MTTPLTPGVYVREAPGGARAIGSAPTAVTIIVGEAERGPVVPTRINSATQYQRLFGGYHRVDAGASGVARLYMPFAVQGFFDNSGPSAYILRLVDGAPATASLDVTDGTNTSRIDAVAPGVWANNIRIIIADAADGDAARFNLIVHYQAPGETAFSEVESFEGLSTNPADEKYLVDQIRRSAYIRWRQGDPDIRPNNIAAPGVPMDDTIGVGGNGALDVANYPAALAALDVVDDAALIVCASDLMLNAATAAEHNDVINAVLSYAVNRPQSDLFLVADPPRSTPETDPVGTAVGVARNNNINASDFIALYWPHVVVSDPVGLGRNPTLTIPAAGHIAGLYGKIDSRRGVWKAAAGITATLSGVIGLDFHIIDQDQDRMNPHGLNALRTVPGAGRVIWGARTLRPMTEWRYINVRRTAMFLRKSIYNSIQWAVFEGNDEPLWAALRETIGSFMETQFRNGAFAGETSRDAYFVKCDSDTTTEDDQVAGVVNVLVGFAPLRPAEFVMVSLSQKTAS